MVQVFEGAIQGISGELWISLDPGADNESTVAKVREVADGYPGLQRDLLT